MPLEPQTKEIPFRFGLDLTEDEEGQPRGALELVNFDFDEEGVMIRRGGFVREEFLGAGTSKFLPDNPAMPPGAPLLLLQNSRVPVAIGSDVTAQAIDTLTTLSPGGRIQAVSASYEPTYGCFCIAVTCSGETVADNASTSYFQHVASFVTYVHIVDAVTGAVYFTKTVIPNAKVVRVARATLAGGGQPSWLIAALGAASNTLLVSAITADPSGGPRKFVSLPGVTSLSTTVTDPGTAQSPRTIDMVSLGQNCQVTWLEGSGPYVWKTATVGVNASGAIPVGSTSTLTPNPSLTQIWVWNAAGTPVYGYLVAASGSDYTVHLLYGAGDYSMGTTNWSGAPRLAFALVSGSTYCLAWNNATVATFGDTWKDGNVQYRLFTTFPTVGASGSAKTYYGMTLGTEAANIDGLFKVGMYPVSTPGTGYANLLLTQYDPDVSVIRTDGQLAFDEYGFSYLWPPEDAVEYNGTYPPPLLPVGTAGFCPVPVALESAPAIGDVGAARTSRQVRRVRLVYFDLASTVAPLSAHLQNTHFITGSYLTACDEQRLFPAAFLAAPAIEPQFYSDSLPNVWGYLALFEWVDLHGNVQVSPPSPVYEYRAAAGVTAPTPTLSIPIPDCIRDVNALSKLAVAGLRIKVYRTQRNGSTFNLIFATRIADTADGVTISFTDSLSDENASLGETLYTTGGALAAELAPALVHLTSHRNRLVGVSSDVPETIRFTSETFAPNYPRWNAVLTFRVDNQGGPPLAVASLFDKLIILQKDQICMVTGEGPDALGNGAFSLPETIARGVGVAQIASVVETPVGIMFAHTTGIHLLTPALEILPIGQAIGGKDFHTQIFHARFLPSRAQVWFLATGKVYVYDLRGRRWTTFEGAWGTLRDVADVGGTIYAISTTTSASGKYSLLRYTFEDRRDQDPAEDSESLVGFTQVVGLPWLRIDRAQEMRLWKVHVTGSQPEWIDPQAAITVEAYSQDERRAKSSTVADNSYQWSAVALQNEAQNFLLRARVVSQRGRALRCRLTVTPDPAYLGGALFRLSALTYDFGILPGRGKARTRAAAA